MLGERQQQACSWAADQTGSAIGQDGHQGALFVDGVGHTLPPLARPAATGAVHIVIVVLLDVLCAESAATILSRLQQTACHTPP